MIETTEIPTDHLIRALQVYMVDLCDESSPFPKEKDYFRNLTGWIGCAVSRLKQLESRHAQQKET